MIYLIVDMNYVLIKILLSLCILLIFFYEKINIYSDRLHPKPKYLFEIINILLSPIYMLINQFIKPLKVGNNLSISIAPFIIFLILLIMIIFF